MNLVLTLLLGGAVSAAPVSGPELDFRTGTLGGWNGSGFYLTPATGRGPSLKFGVSSSDAEGRGQTALLHQTFTLPENAGVIRFQAHAVRGADHEADQNLDVLLMTSDKQIVSKQLRTPGGWKAVPRLVPAPDGRPREYIWPVSALAGQTVRIVLVDEDKRPNCHLFCTGFQLIPAAEFDGQEFAQFMLQLVRDHRLPPVARYESKHFVALSNAEDRFTEVRLNNCELIYDLFFDYFRRRGFRLREPNSKLMVAIFDSQAGFEAYLGHRMPPNITGIYHTGTNRLLVYDYGQNNTFEAQRRHEQQMARRIGSDVDRRRYIDTVNRQAQEFRTETNIGTIMHEVAHQLSFNSGMMNRDGDVAFWLGEGVACFCESTQGGAWQGIGEMNPERLDALAGPVNGHGRLIALHDLLSRDDWLEGKPGYPSPLLAYAQSWALFHMLMNERPQAMRSFLAQTYGRRTGERRLADFTQAFGSDLPRLEMRYQEYMKEMVAGYKPLRR